MAINVFLSVGKPANDSQRQFLETVEAFLRQNDLSPQTPGRTHAANKQPLKVVEECMKSCQGAVVVAYERLYAAEARENRGGQSERLVREAILPTVWNQVEGAMAYALGLPLLVIAQVGLRSEALLENRYDWNVQWVQLDPTALLTPEFQAVLTDWRASVVRSSGQRSALTRRDPAKMSLADLLGSLRPGQVWAASAAVIVALTSLATFAYNLGARDTPPVARTQLNSSLAEDWVKIGNPRSGDQVPWSFPIEGTYASLPDGFDLWVFTTDGSGSSERYWPQQRVLVRDDHTWRGQVNGIGGAPGVRRTFGVFLVGRDGQALLELWGRAAISQRGLELTRLTRDIKKAQEVDVIVRSGRPSH